MSSPSLRAVHLRTEYLVDPLGLDEPRPRFSWIVESDKRGDRQSAYRVAVASSAAAAGRGEGDVWDSGTVSSSTTAQVEYDGPALTSRGRYWWAVQVTDADGAVGGWSTPARFETGLLDPADWQATWVAAPASVRAAVDGSTFWDGFDNRGSERPARFRTTFTLDSADGDGRAYVTAQGVYELFVNGRRVGDDVFNPGWVDFRTRIPYSAYDISDLLVAGENVVAAVVGDGWYSGRIAWNQRVYGEFPSLLAQVHVDGADVVATGAGWVCAPSEIAWSDMLTGEAQDLAALDAGWTSPGYDASSWTPVETVDAPAAPLEAARGVRVRRLRELTAIETKEITPGTFVVDLGQNMVGWARVTLPAGAGAAGDVVRVRHAEMLNPDGTIYTENYRGAEVTDFFRLAGDDDRVVLEPHFTWRGFRYAEVSGLPAGATPEVVGVVLGSDTPYAGSFECSSPMVTKLQQNIEWGQRGNFLEVPTDCPQRDERLGWMGDAQIFVPTACWNNDVAGFFTKWMVDVNDAVSENGAFPDVAPLASAPQVSDAAFKEAAPGWGDAGVIVPWTIFERYGDVRILERCLDSMVGWVKYLTDANPDLLWRNKRNLDYGDWLSIAEDTARDVLATAYFARSTDLVARAARIVGRDDVAEEHEKLFERIKEAFNHAYVTPAGRVIGHTQTAYVNALAFDLLPEEKRAAAAEFLVELICEKRGFSNDFTPGHLATGFLGVGHLMPALSGSGHLDIAYMLLENETFPSWGYSIKNGATTIWERWDGWTEDKGFQSAGMNSFNHYSLGSVGHWLFSVVAGITPDADAPGFERFRIQPQPGGSLTWAKATHVSIRGEIASEWSLADGGAVTLKVTVPTNASADVVVPGATVATLQEGGKPVAEAEGVQVIGDERGGAVVRVGGGTYEFTSA